MHLTCYFRPLKNQRKIKCQRYPVLDDSGKTGATLKQRRNVLFKFVVTNELFHK